MATDQMAKTTILSLPNELIEHICNYLDWNPHTSLRPSKADIRNISLVNRQIRDAVLPILFRDVKLRLRWDEGCLIEPKLFRLRREHGHLMKHVRCVHVQTTFGHFPHQHFGYQPFSVPETLQDWLDPSDTDPLEQPTHRAQTHRQRVENTARRLFNSPNYTHLISESPVGLREHAEAVINKLFGKGDVLKGAVTDGDRLARDTFYDDAREEPDLTDTLTTAASNIPPDATVRLEQHQRRQELRNLRLQLDALVLTMLCFPPNVKSMVFESLPRSKHDSLQDAFAHHVASSAIEIFGDRLETLSMVTYDLDRGLPAVRTVPNAEICSMLESVKRLTLCMEGERMPGSHRTTVLPDRLEGWHSIAHTVKDLAIWRVELEPGLLIRLLKGFKNLLYLTLNEISLVLPFQPGQRRGAPSPPVWLTVLIDIRREMPSVILDVRKMKGSNTENFGPSASRWLVNEAVPVGHPVNYERETRLLEDFESFLPLWAAEDSERGVQASKAREDGWLVDAAMSSRWRGLSKPTKS